MPAWPAGGLFLLWHAQALGIGSRILAAAAIAAGLWTMGRISER